MAVLSKAGCNAGTCHGNLNGKGGFKLSLRGENPALDFRALARDQMGRRVNTFDPDQSLLLRKATMQLAHEGGKRFDANSPEYEVLRAWIAAGAADDPQPVPRVVRVTVTPGSVLAMDPDDSVTLRVEAEYADGTRRDVTRMAVYEPSNLSVHVTPAGEVLRRAFGETSIIVRYLERQTPVRVTFLPERPERPLDVPRENYIDRHVFDRLAELRIEPSELSDDRTFLRRVFLDLLGILPTPEESAAFLADEDPRKRSQWIDRLLARPEFAEHWALKWSDLLRNEEKTLDLHGVTVYHEWIKRSIADGKPLDQFVREILAARGSTYENPPANFYRALRDPVSRAEAAAQVFLGTRLQCAKCHTHPFDRWTQDDYYQWAALFTRIEYEVVKNDRRDKFDQHEFVGEQIVKLAKEGEIKNARTNQPAPPKLLGADAPAAGDDPLAEVADWVVSPGNPLFARVQANRIWYQLLGRGLVEPVDDFRATNPPSHPELLDALAEDLVASGFDLKHLIRTIANSRTYQLSSIPNDTNADDQTNYSRAIVRRLPAEQLLDAIHHVAGVRGQFKNHPAGLRAGQLPTGVSISRRGGRPSDDDILLATFGKPERLLVCECERSNGTTLAQALALVSGEAVHAALSDSDGRLARMARSDRAPRELVAELYWIALCREPTAEELDAMETHFAAAQDRRAALQDIAWALINAKEFLFRY
jgi:hypothetical protein